MRATVAKAFRLSYHGKQCGGVNLPFATQEGAIAYARSRYALGFTLEQLGDGPAYIAVCGIRPDARCRFALFYPGRVSAKPVKLAFVTRDCADAAEAVAVLTVRGFVAVCDYLGGEGLFTVSTNADARDVEAVRTLCAHGRATFPRPWPIAEGGAL